MKLEIKNYRRTPKLRGAGDVVGLVTTLTGIKAATESVAEFLGVDCKCEERKEWLNEKIPFVPPLTSRP